MSRVRTPTGNKMSILAHDGQDGISTGSSFPKGRFGGSQQLVESTGIIKIAPISTPIFMSPKGHYMSPF
jgi:hypothetical protein